MFWASMCGGSFLALGRSSYELSPSFDLFYELLAVLLVVSPFIAVGSLFGRPVTGIIVCGCTLLVVTLLTSIF
jgi:hypothetical protein